jgi:hypothetical protein
MNIIIRESLKQLIADRYLLEIVSIMILLSIIFAIIIGLSISPSEIQLISHYSAFGITNYYFNQWFYLIVFVLFEPIVAILHSVISVKLLVVRGHSFAVMFVWLGIGIIILGLITALKVIVGWKPL